MILKVAGYSEFDDSTKWFMWDNVNKISYQRLYNTESTKKFIESCEDVLRFIESDAYKSVLFIICRMGDTELSIVTDDMAYILNDDGKTIERIN
jgi:hypothetical protein